MIQSMFIITSTGSALTPSQSFVPHLSTYARREVLIEKHWRGITNRSVCETFLEQVAKYRERIDVPPVIVSNKYYLISVFRDELFFLAIVANEVRISICAQTLNNLFWQQIQISPLSVIEFLHRVLAVFRDYFGEFNEHSIKDNFSTVYQVRSQPRVLFLAIEIV